VTSIRAGIGSGVVTREWRIPCYMENQPVEKDTARNSDFSVSRAVVL